MGIETLIEAANFVEYQAMLASLPHGFSKSANLFTFLQNADPLSKMKDSSTTLGHAGEPIGTGPNLLTTAAVPGAPVASPPPVPAPGGWNSGKKASPEPEPQQQQQVLKKLVRNREQLQRHCEQVKVQRAYLRGCLEELRHLLPIAKTEVTETGYTFGRRQSTSTYGVLSTACQEILRLTREEAEMLKEIEGLKANSVALKEKVAELGGTDCDGNGEGEETKNEGCDKTDEKKMSDA